MQVTIIPAARQEHKTRVAAYVRVSTLLEDQEESYETQAEFYEKKIRDNPDWEFAGVYGERVSGTHMENREEFQKLLQDAKDGKVDLILAKSVSRWARNAVDALKTVRELRSYHVGVIFEQEGLDTRDPGALLTLNMASSVAQSESVSISENMKWTFRKKTDMGIFKAKKDWYIGYNTDDGNFTPDEKTAPMIRRIFKEYVDGESLTDIANGLNDDGYRSRRGNTFKAWSVRDLLLNEVYVGDLEISKTPSHDLITGQVDKEWHSNYVKGHHEGLVDRRTWDAAQWRLSKGWRSA